MIHSIVEQEAELKFMLGTEKRSVLFLLVLNTAYIKIGYPWGLNLLSLYKGKIGTGRFDGGKLRAMVLY